MLLVKFWVTHFSNTQETIEHFPILQLNWKFCYDEMNFWIMLRYLKILSAFSFVEDFIRCDEIYRTYIYGFENDVSLLFLIRCTYLWRLNELQTWEFFIADYLIKFIEKVFQSFLKTKRYRGKQKDEKKMQMHVCFVKTLVRRYWYWKERVWKMICWRNFILILRNS